jgi:hypothetical protein
MKNLAVQFIGDSHCAAVTDATGAAVMIPDADSRREFRPSEVALESDGFGVGMAAVKASLAGLSSPPCLFRPADLQGFREPVVSAGALTLSSEGVLALLLRKAIADAQPLGPSFDKIVLALDHQGPAHQIAALEAFLSDVLEIPTVIHETRRALDGLLRNRMATSGGRTQLALAVLDDKILVGKAIGDSIRSIQLPNQDGLGKIRRHLLLGLASDKLSSAWSRHRLWSDFIQWYTAQQIAPEGTREPFLPHLVDHDFQRSAITTQAITRTLQRVFSAAAAGLSGAAQGLQPGADLQLLGDASIRLGLREALTPLIHSLGLRVVSLSLDRLALSMAEQEICIDRPGRTTASFGLLVRDRQEAEKEFRVVVGPGTSLPATGQALFSAGTPGQRRLKFDLALEREGSRPTLLRQIFLEHKGAANGIRSIEIRFRINESQHVRLEAVDAQSREPLAFVESRMPGEHGQVLAGPEMIASLPLAGV